LSVSARLDSVAAILKVQGGKAAWEVRRLVCALFLSWTGQILRYCSGCRDNREKKVFIKFPVREYEGRKKKESRPRGCCFQGRESNPGPAEFTTFSASSASRDEHEKEFTSQTPTLTPPKFCRFSKIPRKFWNFTRYEEYYNYCEYRVFFSKLWR